MAGDALPIVMRDVVFEAGGRRVIDGLSAVIGSRGVTAIVGPNGAGKSLTLRLLDRLIMPRSGSICFGGLAPSHVRRALAFQSPRLLRASVARNVAIALLPERLPRAQAARRVDAALARVGLRERAEDPARKLSGGEQQRVALARAWAARPDVLLLDEPTANLDPGAAEAIEALILDLSRAGTKVVMVSHNLGQVARVAEDTLVLAAGRAVEHGPTGRVLSAPQSPQARAYLSGELPWAPFVGRSS